MDKRIIISQCGMVEFREILDNPPAPTSALRALLGGWRSMTTAPRDGTEILLLTADFGVVQGWWDEGETNFYKSQNGWASYDPENQLGEWVSEWIIDPSHKDDHRLYCGCTPEYWMPVPPKPENHD